MLLGSPPDMVHEFPLRKTDLFITAFPGQATHDATADRNSSPLQRIASDRAPLTPQLVRPCPEPEISRSILLYFRKRSKGFDVNRKRLEKKRD